MNKAIFFVIIILLAFILPSCTDCEYQMETYIEPLVFNGLVINKYIDQENHLFPKVEIKNESEIITFLPAEKFSGKLFFEYVQVNDSIFKVKGSRTIQIKRNSDISEFTFSCKEF